jgi:hypothetical protein
MNAAALKRGIERILREEKAYAAKLHGNGEFGRAKLALAAIDGIRAALRHAAPETGDGYAERLLGALEAERSCYAGLWDDEDGVGTSTFARVIDQVSPMG